MMKAELRRHAPYRLRLPMLARTLLMCIVLLLLPFAGTAAAQIPFPTGSASEAPAAKKQVSAKRRSARATIRTFLDSAVKAAKDDDPTLLEDAASCLDLSDIPSGLRDVTGRDLAIKLKEAIDRIKYVVYAEVPDDPNGDEWVFYVEPSLDARIAIAPNADGEWLFTTETVRNIEDLYRHFEPLPKVEGVGGSGLEMSTTLWLRSKMPASLHDKVFLLENWQWLGLLVLVVLGWIVARVARFMLHGPVQKILDRREWRVPREKVWRLLAPTGFVATAVLWWIGIRILGLPPGIQMAALLVVKFMVALGVVRTAFRFIDIVTWVLKTRAEKTPSKFDDLIVPFFDKSAKVVVVAIGCVFIADVLGISPASLLAGLGIGGLAVALAAQDTVKNLFGSLTVVLDRPFEIGDDVRIGSDITGTVEEVGFRSTRIRTWENTLITVPNGNLISANVDNLGRRTFFRYKAMLNLSYDTPPERIHAFCEGLRELVLHHPNTRKEGVIAGLHELAASSLDVLFICHFAVPTGADHVRARHHLLLDIVSLASRLGVEFAYPTSTVNLVAGSSKKARGPLPAHGKDGAAQAERIGKAEAHAVMGAASGDRTSDGKTPQPSD